MHVGSCGVMRLLIRGDTCTLVTGYWMLDAGAGYPRHIPPTCVNFLPRKRQQPLYPLGMNDSSLATLPRIVVQLTIFTGN